MMVEFRALYDGLMLAIEIDVFFCLGCVCLAIKYFQENNIKKINHF